MSSSQSIHGPPLSRVSTLCGLPLRKEIIYLISKDKVQNNGVEKKKQ